MDDLQWREGLFESFDKLVEIEVCKQKSLVPENNKILRGFQYLKTDTISVGDYCWNGDCVNCQIWYEADAGEIKGALACKMYVREGLVISALSAELQEDLFGD
ncbi:MAG: hypothetical protein HY231_10105 [Acidobacteria bacterium]|nr:hypothetical protein [Acidobacteriota bacterium]